MHERPQRDRVDRRHGLPRVASLRKTPASARFLSVEPLFEGEMQRSIEGAREYRTRLEPPPGDRRVTHSGRRDS